MVEIEVQDPHNPVKVHVFRKYADYHVAYNQKIAGRLFYGRFTRINRQHGYHHLLRGK